VIFCNDSGYDLLGMSREVKSEMTSKQPWMQSIFPDDYDHLEAHWKILVEEQRPVTFEYRVSRPWSPPSDPSTPIQMNETWILSNAYPDVSEEGILTITAVLSDITHQKWAESIQLQQLSEALESKRQKENFMDMTSHEMRNPLHAILQCAEEIMNVLQSLERNCGKHGNNFENCLKAAQTILYCGGHQKRIIDDILTLSKLDPNLLALAPVKVKPADVVKQVLKIFETELRVSDITTHVSLGPSYQEHAVGTVMMDDSRIIQVMINLMSNAIKFTKDCPWWTLDIALSCSPEKPHDDVGYVPSGRPRKDLTQQVEWREGDVIYLHFSVRDTGPGILEDVMNVLFARFGQASPRTHVRYGGSRLGLFIS
jgi:signal transduction histidine kinase